MTASAKELSIQVSRYVGSARTTHTMTHLRADLNPSVSGEIGENSQRKTGSICVICYIKNMNKFSDRYVFFDFPCLVCNGITEMRRLSSRGFFLGSSGMCLVHS